MTTAGGVVPPQGRRTTVLVLSGWVATILIVHVWGEHLVAQLGSDEMRLSAPPLVGWEDLAIGLSTAVPIAVGAISIVVATRILPRQRWRAVLATAALLTVAWAGALALARSPVRTTDPDHLSTEGVTRPLQAAGDEYLLDVPRVGDDPVRFLREFTSDIDTYATHVRSHPPGFLLLLWLLDRGGLAGPWPAAIVCLAGGASAVVAVLVAARDVSGAAVARRAAPFVALAPGVLWIATSADAFYAGLATWAVALTVLASSRHGRPAGALATASGVLWGVGLLCSYGLVLLALPMVIVLGFRRRWSLGPLVLAGAVVPLLLAGAAGFNWLDGLAATRREYWQSVASTRPQRFFFFSNLAALAVVVGPATVVGLTRLRDRGLVLLVGGFGAAILVANISAMAKGEVERIWLPFALWLPLACASLPTLGESPTRRSRARSSAWLGAQLAVALAVQVTIRTRW